VPSAFEAIIAGDLACHKIYEDEHSLAFLDINPLAKGHTLVIPKKRNYYIFDMPEDEYQHLWEAARAASRKLRKALGVQRVVCHVEGFEVQHVHIHLLPANNSVFASPPVDKTLKKHLAETAEQINAIGDDF